MNNKILAICDSEATYADLLTRQLLRVPGSRLEIRKFNDFDKLKEFSVEHPITYLLISEDYVESSHVIDALAYYILTNNKATTRVGNSGMEYLYRYQGVNEIYERISGINLSENEGLSCESKNDEFQVIGLYNPVRRNGQTTFARNLAFELGRGKHKVLYINMDEISVGVDKLRDPEQLASGKGSISDIMYYIKQNPERLTELLKRTVFQGRRYDTIASPPIFTETHSIKLEEWLKLMELLEVSGYNIVILDLDSKIQGYLEILERCNKVYAPELEGSMSQDKRDCFNKALRVVGKNKLLIKMESIRVPKYDTDINTQLGAFIKNNILV